jgi:hypothetical protein
MERRDRLIKRDFCLPWKRKALFILGYLLLVLSTARMASALPLRGMVVSGEYYCAVEAGLMRNLGCQAMRWGFNQSGGVIDYGIYDRAVSLMRDDGVEILAIIGIGTISWSDPSEWGTAEFRGRFAARASEIASHYEGQISAYEIWNEQNLPGVRIEPEPYGALLTAAFEAIHAGDPDALVILGGLGFASPESADYLRGVYQSVAVQAFFTAEGYYPFHKVATHPYTYDRPPSETLATELVQYVTSVMNEFGDDDKGVWVTEIGWNTSPTLGAMGPDEIANEAAQAAYYADTVDIVSGLVDPASPDGGPFVEALFWYQLRDTGEQKFGLLREMGRPKPAYYGFQSYPERPSSTPTPTPEPTCPELGENLLRNGSFELGTPGYEAIPDNWTPWESDPADDNHYWYLDLHPDRPGLELRMISYGRMDCGVYQTVGGLTPGVEYWLSGWVYANAPDSGAFQARAAMTDGTALGFPDELEWEFVAPFGLEGREFMIGPFVSSGTSATVWLRANNPAATFYHADFDDVALRPVSGTSSIGLWFAY